MTILNPGAEDGTNNWTSTVGALGTLSASPDPYEGSAFFYGGTVAQTNAYQDIPIPSGLHTAVDEGRLHAQLAWQASSFTGLDDSRINLSWFDDESPENLLGNQRLGVYVSPGQTWVAQENVHAAPVGARALRIEMDMNRDSGSQNNGQIDAITGTWRIDP
jgi:hypothetical protein